MTAYVDRAGLKIADVLARFVEDDVLPPLGMDAGPFWSGVADVFARFAPRNKALLAKRDELQAKIDAWHKTRPHTRRSCARSAIWFPSRSPSRSTRSMSMTSWRGWPDRNWWCLS